MVVLVATVRALKHHGNGDLHAGYDNLRKHIQNIKNFGLPVTVCINKFSDDTQDDLDYVHIKAMEYGAIDCVVSEHWAKGSEGALDLANSVVNSIKVTGKHTINHPYEPTDHFTKKIQKVCTKVYGIKDVLFQLEVQVKLRDDSEKYGHLPICVSKTHKTFEPKAGENFVWVTDVELRAGAEYIVVKLGNTITLPGLPESPQAEQIDVIDGKIIGLN
jgi:formate--tetrahydrofolate ligase